MFKVKDHYFQKAKNEGHLARSFYKIEEINKKFNLINSDQRILDCGYFPGSWLEYIGEKIGEKGLAIGVDIKKPELAFRPNTTVLQRDIREIKVLEDLEYPNLLPFHGIVSDMAPNTTGNVMVDQMAQLELVEWVFKLIPIILKKNGFIIIKIFESGDSQKFIKDNKHIFTKWNYFRPKAIRSSSKETYGIGTGYKI